MTIATFVHIYTLHISCNKIPKPISHTWTPTHIEKHGIQEVIATTGNERGWHHTDTHAQFENIVNYMFNLKGDRFINYHQHIKKTQGKA